MGKKQNPTQPVVLVGEVARFKGNTIVRQMLDRLTTMGVWNLNNLAVEVGTGRHSADDYQQFVQLIGYSVCGYGELNTNGRVYAAAQRKVHRLFPTPPQPAKGGEEKA